MPNNNRRLFLTRIAQFIGGSVVLTACSSNAVRTTTKTSNEKSTVNNVPVEFNESVASGDPKADRVILWTRLTPRLTIQNKAALILNNVVWQVAKDAEFSTIVSEGITSASGVNNFCIKVDATGLQPATRYYYRFTLGDQSSPIGRTKTLPVGETKEASFAVVSCSNYGHGYFHVYSDIAAREDLDFVLHLGDYIYEYQDDVYTDPKLVASDRALEPKHETLTLDDYRARYQCYRSDKDLQAVHASHPFVVIWDDHELANDAWIEGAQGHQEGEGEWNERKVAAMRAFREFMPIRDPESTSESLQIYRQFDIGNLASLIMLDTRLIGRDEQLNYRSDNVNKDSLEDPSRNLLGAEQEAWLVNKLKASKIAQQPWQIIGQQLLTGRVCMPDVADIIAPVDQGQRDFQNGLIEIGKQDLPMNMDAWDGYNAAKQRLLDHYKFHANNVISLAGDTHNSWAFELTRDEDRSSATHSAVAVEFGTPSVSSPGMESWFPTSDHAESAKRMVAKNKELVFHDNNKRGWVELRLTPKQAMSKFHYIDGVKTRLIVYPMAPSLLLTREHQSLSSSHTLISARRDK